MAYCLAFWLVWRLIVFVEDFRKLISPTKEKENELF